ncbi:MAG: exodeoxyribonuclease VII large subunit [Candidatus Poribacteria bacterium]|nr:exodeoxyribonuclease VII large subunit [Candidatus Poribacteria bacterium]
MPTVYNVSEITNILSSTIQRNVLVQGEVEILADSPPNAFFLQHEGKKLRCFIPGGNISRFGSLLTSGNIVVVDGRITLFSRFSQYQITVSDISANGISTNAFSVTEITDKISHLVESTPALQDIQVQGRVLEVFEAAVSNWDLCDIGGSPVLRIKCVRPGFINFPVQRENNVCVRGEVGIYPSQSRYEIKVIDPVTEASTPTCQCRGCNSCHPQRGNQSCPPLQNPEYELCPNCYHESPDREDRVAQAVYAYFYALGGNGFSSKKESRIQFGARSGRADVVLIKEETQTFAAIAECKGAGYEGNGKAQLSTYLSATRTRLGLFANRADPKQWKFYKEQRPNQFNPITCDQFKKAVKELTDRSRLLIIVNKLKNLFSKENE